MISRELIKYDEARKWFATWQEDIEVGLPGKQHKFTLTNTNKLIKSYNGATGIKTGFTQDAGYCLSGAATRNGTSMIGVVLGCKTSKIRFKEMSRLLDHGFANYGLSGSLMQAAGSGAWLFQREKCRDSMQYRRRT